MKIVVVLIALALIAMINPKIALLFLAILTFGLIAALSSADA